ncbi:hypothetical protein BH11MYX1_BH11MYX1_37790 [soil metagenome]
MANHNGRTERDDARKFSDQQYRSFKADSENIEHGYQDPRDQRDPKLGRDDFRGGDFASRNFQATDRTDRSAPGIPGIAQVGDEYAERDRNASADRGRFGRDGVETTDYRRGGGYGTQPTNERGQSGVQAGGRGPGAYRGPASRGGNDGQWGDFDRGGRSARSPEASSYDTQAPQYGAQDPRASHIGSSQRYGEPQRWSAEQSRGLHAGKGPQGFVRSDERILELVHEVLTDHEHIDASNITVTVKVGEVTLTGHVDKRSAKLQAEDLVSTVNGVKDVHNQLRVGAPSTSGSQAESPVASAQPKQAGPR